MIHPVFWSAANISHNARHFLVGDLLLKVAFDAVEAFNLDTERRLQWEQFVSLPARYQCQVFNYVDIFYVFLIITCRLPLLSEWGARRLPLLSEWGSR